MNSKKIKDKLSQKKILRNKRQKKKTKNLQTTWDDDQNTLNVWRQFKSFFILCFFDRFGLP